MSLANEHIQDGMDWPGLLRTGLGRLGLKPWEFWALTPAELAMMLGQTQGVAPMKRSQMDALIARYPDHVKGEIDE